MLSGLVLMAAMNATMVPPGYPVVNHGAPGHYTQPVLRRYERFEEDYGRRMAWERYCRRLDVLWQQYRDAGSSPAAWEVYKLEALRAKRDYVFADPYLAPVVYAPPVP
jgi:hypothetical protein